MRAKKKLNSGLNSAKIAVIFFVFVFLVVATSLIFKAFNVVSKSRFDNVNRFTISVSNNKDFKIISFSPRAKSISILRFDDDAKNIDINKFLEIPIDGNIKSFLNIKDFTAQDLMFQFIVNYRNLKTNLTFIDVIRLYWFARSVPINYTYDKNISTSMDASRLNKITTLLFSDEVLEKENLSVKIVNATDVNGLGNRTGRLISNMGGNVVIIASSDSMQNESSISYFGQKSYTVEKLYKILGFKVIKMNEKAIADIVILIGKDSLPKLKF